MNIKQLKRFIPYANKINATLMVHGLHGIGKSQSIKQYAEENGLEFIDRRLSQIESGDLLGLPDVSGEVTQYKLPNWLPRDPKSKGILFLDEINRARRDVLQGVFQLVLDRQLGDYTLPAGWQVISAVNPNTDDFDVTDVFDKALTDRFLHIKLTPTTEEFLMYAKTKTNVSQSYINFLQLNEDKIENTKLASFSLEREPSRRSSLKAAELIDLDLPSDLFVEGVGGLVGMTTAVAYQTWLVENDVKPFSGAEIAKKYDKIKDKITAYTDPMTGRHDVIQASYDNLFAYISENYKKIKDNETDNILTFLESTPKDLAFAFCDKLLKSSDNNSDILQNYIIPKIIESNRTDNLLLNDKDKDFIASTEIK